MGARNQLPGNPNNSPVENLTCNATNLAPKYGHCLLIEINNDDCFECTADTYGKSS